jgi:hypothetical protein
VRLGDLDALKDEMRAGCVPIDLGGITGITGDDDSIEDYIDAAPTIDAIPVEWLQKYTAVGVTPRGDRLTEGKERLIVRRILNDWHKEQEAR